MSYFSLACKMFRKRASQYRLFWIAQVIIVTLFFSVYVFYRTPDFMLHFSVVSQQIVDSTNLGMISIIAFGACFIPFSHWLLFLRRTKDFSILLSIGLSRRMMYEQILVEHIFLDITAAICGLIAGSGLAALFYCGIVFLLGLSPLEFPLCLKAYIDSSLRILVIDGISIAGIMLSCMGKTIRKIGTLGDGRKNRSFYIPYFMKRKIIEDIYTYKRRYQIRRKTIFLQVINTVLFTLLILTMVLCALTTKWMNTYGEVTHPYDLIYVNEVLGLENEKQYNDQQIKKLMDKNGVSTEKFTELDCYRDGAYNLIDVDEINRVFHTKYQVDQGTLFQIFRETRDYWASGFIKRPLADPVTIPLESGEKKFPVVDFDVNMLFGFPCMADRIVLVNHEDYLKLDDKIGHYYLQKNYLMKFKTWRESAPVVEEIKKTLGKEAYRALYSRYIYEQNSQQNLMLEVVLFSLIGSIFYFGSLLCIYFWYKMHQREQSEEYQKLYEIGMEKERIRQAECEKLHFLFWPVGLFQIWTGIFFIAAINGGTEFLKDVTRYLFVVIGCFIAFHTAVEHYWKKKLK